MKEDYNRLAKRLFRMEEWQAVVAILADLETSSVNSLRDDTEGTEDHVAMIRTIGKVRSQFRQVAEDVGADDPFARLAAKVI